jgi:hypothetical protein
MRVNVQT